MQENM